MSNAMQTGMWFVLVVVAVSGWTVALRAGSLGDPKGIGTGITSLFLTAAAIVAAYFLGVAA